MMLNRNEETEHPCLMLLVVSNEFVNSLYAHTQPGRQSSHFKFWLFWSFFPAFCCVGVSRTDFCQNYCARPQSNSSIVMWQDKCFCAHYSTMVSILIFTFYIPVDRMDDLGSGLTSCICERHINSVDERYRAFKSLRYGWVFWIHSLSFGTNIIDIKLWTLQNIL